jgi:hypothetical protein
MFVLEVVVTLEALAAERRDLDAREAAWLQRVAVYGRSGQAHSDGYLGAAAALRDACHLDPGVASGHVKLARKLEALPVTADAFAGGAISRRHAQVIADASTPERAAALSALEPIVVQTAKHVTPKELHRVVRYAATAPTPAAPNHPAGAKSTTKSLATRRRNQPHQLPTPLPAPPPPPPPRTRRPMKTRRDSRPRMMRAKRWRVAPPQ